MNKTLRGSFFVVKGLGVLLIGLPSIVLAAALFCWLMSMVIFPALLIGAVLLTLWKLPGLIKYRRAKGEWIWVTRAKAKGWKPGDGMALLNAELLDVERRDRAGYRQAELARFIARLERGYYD